MASNYDGKRDWKKKTHFNEYHIIQKSEIVDKRNTIHEKKIQMKLMVDVSLNKIPFEKYS